MNSPESVPDPGDQQREAGTGPRVRAFVDGGVTWWRSTGPRTRAVAVAGLVLVMGWAAISIRAGGEAIMIEIPSGATSHRIAEILEEHDVIGSSGLFRAYMRLRRADRHLKAGIYEMETGSSMRAALRQLTHGEVETFALTIPEGFQAAEMAPRIAEITGADPDEVAAYLRDPGLADSFGVPGPTIEGYLFPDTYRFARGVPVKAVVRAMVERYREVWTPDRRARLEASDMTEAEAVTLASIVQAEARKVEEMPRIAGVYRNRLREGWLLQADPTVIYALGGYRERLLYAAIDSVQDDPYNTYTNRGLPPGPIGSPGERAIDAALRPEPHDFMYFVARPDGSHVFTETLAQHNAAKEEAQRARAGNKP